VTVAKKPKVTGHVSFGYVGVWINGEQVFESKTVDREIREGESIADIIGQLFLFPDPPPSPAAMTPAPAPRKRVKSREVKRIGKQ
jgi:hypothetical protein